MADTKDAPKAPVEAAAAEQAPVPQEGKSHSVKTSVFAVAGGVAKNSVLQSAIASVRDAIPVVYELNAEITGSRKGERGGEKGTVFEVTVTYTPRATAGKEDPVDPERVIKDLTVPKSLDGIFGHDGDPEFLGPQQ